MKTNTTRSIILLFLFTTIAFLSCRPAQSTYSKIEPAEIKQIGNSKISQLTLTEMAVSRISIQTDKVQEEQSSDSVQSLRKVVPYAAVLYDTEGKTWVYTNPDPLVYIRHEIDIDFIKGDKAILLDGPSIGTNVVTRGASELLGTEYHVGH